MTPEGVFDDVEHDVEDASGFSGTPPVGDQVFRQRVVSSDPSP